MVGLTRGGANPLTASFTYDYLGRRASKTINGVTTNLCNNGLDCIVEATVGGGTSATLYGPGIDNPLARDGLYFLPNHLGSTSKLTDATGAVVQSCSHLPFGEASQSTAVSNPFQFTARENDGTALYYYRNRYYAPEWGRFLSADPAGFVAGPNQYAYANNNPLNGKDPIGLDPETDQEVQEGGVYPHPNYPVPGGGPEGGGEGAGSGEAGGGGVDAPIDPGVGGGEGGGGGFAPIDPVGGGVLPMDVQNAIAAENAARASYFGSPSELGAAAELEWRAWLEGLGVTLVPKSGPYAGGPDAVWSGTGTDPGWLFAELKPNNSGGIAAGFAQIQQRFAEGYAAPGQLYVWGGTPGNFTFSQVGTPFYPNPQLPF